MVYTITFNPAVDYTMQVSNVSLGTTNRSTSEYFQPGGKGINCSLILNRLGVKVTNTGFLPEQNNELILKTLTQEKIAARFLPISGSVRINVKIKGEQETEINAQGATVSNLDWVKLLELVATFQGGDFIIIAGNLAPGMTQAQLEALLVIFKQKQIKFALDINSNNLKDCLQYEPIIIKPNLAELEFLCDKKIASEEDIILEVQKLQQLGATNVLVSLGSAGAIYISQDGLIYRIGIAKGKLVSSVGAGDSMLAGFIASYFIQKQPLDMSLKMAAACGGATSFQSGLATKLEIMKLVKTIDIKKVEWEHGNK